MRCCALLALLALANAVSLAASETVDGPLGSAAGVSLGPGPTALRSAALAAATEAMHGLDELPRPPLLRTWAWRRCPRWQTDDAPGRTSLKTPRGRLEAGSWLRFHLDRGLALRLVCDRELDEGERAALHVASQFAHDDERAPSFGPAGELPLRWLDRRTAHIEMPWPEPEALLVELDATAGASLGLHVEQLVAEPLEHGWQRLAWELPGALAADLDPAPWLLGPGRRVDAIGRILAALPGGRVSAVPAGWRSSAVASLALDLRLALLRDMPRDDRQWFDRGVAWSHPELPGLLGSAATLAFLPPAPGPWPAALLAAEAVRREIIWDRGRAAEGLDLRLLPAGEQRHLVVEGPGLLELRHRPRYHRDDEPFVTYGLTLRYAQRRIDERHLASPDLAEGYDPLGAPVGREGLTALPLPPGRWTIAVGTDRDCWLGARLRRRLPSREQEPDWEAAFTGLATAAAHDHDPADPWSWWLRGLAERRQGRVDAAAEAFARAAGLIDDHHPLATVLPNLRDSCRPGPYAVPDLPSPADPWHKALGRELLLRSLSHPRDLEHAHQAAQAWLAEHDDPAVHAALAELLQRWPDQEYRAPLAVRHLLAAWRARPTDAALRERLVAAWSRRAYWSDLTARELPRGAGLDRFWPSARLESDATMQAMAGSHPQLMPAAWQNWVQLPPGEQVVAAGELELMALRPPGRREPSRVELRDGWGLRQHLACFDARSSRQVRWWSDDPLLRIRPPDDTHQLLLRGPRLAAALLRNGPRARPGGHDHRPFALNGWQARRLLRLEPGRGISWWLPTEPDPTWVQLQFLLLEEEAPSDLTLSLLVDGRAYRRLRLGAERCALPSRSEPHSPHGHRLSRHLSWTGALPDGARRLELRCEQAAATQLAVGLSVRRQLLRVHPGDPVPTARRQDEPPAAPPPSGSPLEPQAGIVAGERLELLGLRLAAAPGDEDAARLHLQRARLLDWMGFESAAQEDWRRVLALRDHEHQLWIDAALDLQWSLAGWSDNAEAADLVRRLRSLGIEGLRMRLRRAAELLNEEQPDSRRIAALLLPLLDDATLAETARIGLALLARRNQAWGELAAQARALLLHSPLDRPGWRAGVPLLALAQLRLGLHQEAATGLTAAAAELEAALPADHQRRTPERWRAVAAAIAELPLLAAAPPGHERALAVARLQGLGADLDPIARWQALGEECFLRHGPRRRIVLGADPRRGLDHLPLGGGETVELEVVGPLRLRLALRSLNRADGAASRPMLLNAAIDGQEPLRWPLPPGPASPHWRLDDGSGLLVGHRETRDLEIGPGRRRLRISCDQPALLRLQQRADSTPLVPGIGDGERWAALHAQAADDPAMRARLALPPGRDDPLLLATAGNWPALLALAEDLPPAARRALGDPLARALLAQGEAGAARRLARDPELRARALLDHWFGRWPELLDTAGPGQVHQALAELAALPRSVAREAAAGWLANSLGERCQRQRLLRVQGQVDQVDLEAPPAAPPGRIAAWQASDLRDLLVAPDWRSGSVFLAAGIPVRWQLDLPETCELLVRLHGHARGPQADGQGALQVTIDGHAREPRSIDLAGRQYLSLGRHGPGRLRLELRCDFPDHAWHLRQGLLSSRPLVDRAPRVVIPAGEYFAVERPIRIQPYRLGAGGAMRFEVDGPNRLHLTSRSHEGRPHAYRVRIGDESDHPLVERLVSSGPVRPQLWRSLRNDSRLSLGQPHREGFALGEQRRYRITISNPGEDTIYLAPAYDVVDLQRRPPPPAPSPVHEERLAVRAAAPLQPPAPVGERPLLQVKQRGTWSLLGELRLNAVDEPKADEVFQDQLVAGVGWQQRFDMGLWLGAGLQARELFDERALATDVELRAAQPLWTGGLTELRLRNHEQHRPFRANSSEILLSLGQRWKLRDDLDLRGELSYGSWTSNIEARAALPAAERDRIVYEVFNAYRADHDRWLSASLRARWRPWQDLWLETRGSLVSNPSLEADGLDRFRLDSRVMAWTAGWQWQAGGEYLQRMRDDDRRTYSYELTAFGRAEYHGWRGGSLWRPYGELRLLLRQRGIQSRLGIEWWFGGKRDQPYHDWPPGLDFDDRHDYRWAEGRR